MSDRIRSERQRLGLSQQALADRAGLSRQLVGAMEAGRHKPSVAAALSTARVLGVTVEDLFGNEQQHFPTAVLGDVAQGPVRAGRVGDEVVVASVAAYDEWWALADGVASGAIVELFPGVEPAELVVAGCDPLLGAMAEQVARSSRHRMMVVHASTSRAIDALRHGRVHAAVVHGPRGTLEVPDGVAVRRWRLASWQAGLASWGRTAVSVEEVAERKMPVLQRERGASTQAALRRALRRVGAGPSVPGPVAAGHLDVARRLRCREAKAGITMEAAALAFGLVFTPMEVHEVEVWVEETWVHQPSAVALVDVLRGGTFARSAATLPGYDLAGIGTTVSRRRP